MGTDKPTESPALPAWRWALLPGAGLAVLADIGIAVWKEQETAAFVVVLLLAWLGWMVLLDRDACRIAGAGREVYMVHATALAFGAATGVMASLLRKHANIGHMHLEALLLLFLILPLYNVLTALACRAYVTFALSIVLMLHGFLLGIVLLHIAYGGFFLDDLFFVLAVYAVIALAGGAAIRWLWLRIVKRTLAPIWAVNWAVLSAGGLVVWWLLVRT